VKTVSDLQAEQEVKFFNEIVVCARESWRVGVVNAAVLACVLRTTSKKGRQLFDEKNCTPEKILATPVNCSKIRNAL